MPPAPWKVVFVYIYRLLRGHSGKNYTFHCKRLKEYEFNPWVGKIPWRSMLVTQSCPTLCDPMDGSPPSSSVHGIFLARILEWVAISFSRGSTRSRDWSRVSCSPGRRKWLSSPVLFSGKSYGLQKSRTWLRDWTTTTNIRVYACVC